MSLTLDQVARIAHLARIEVTPAESEAVRDKLNGILAMIDELQSIDTTNVAPMAHAQDLAQRLRDDAVSETDRRAAYQAVAPETEAGLYLVPKVIE